MKRRFLKNVGRALLVFFVGASAHAGTTDLATSPLVTSAASSVRPNLMFVLDDSGSMDWAFLPDWADTSSSPSPNATAYPDPVPATALTAFEQQSLSTNNGFNGVAYSPTVVYNPPLVYNTLGGIDTTTYPSMTSANTGAWTSVKNDGYGVQSISSSNLVGKASYYTFVAGEYCDNPNLRNCVLATAPSTAFPFPAALRWCSSNAMTACQAVRIDAGTTKFNYRRYPPLAATATIKVLDTNSITITVAAPSSPSSTSVSGITVNGTQIMKTATGASTSTTTLASAIQSSINTCMADTTTCNSGGAKDYVATLSGSVVTVTGSSIAGSTAVVTHSTPTKPLTFTVANNATTSTTVTGITATDPLFNGNTTPSTTPTPIQLLSVTTTSSTNINTVAANIAAGINLCTAAKPGNCTIATGYSATALNNIVTITAQRGISTTPAVTAGTGSMTFAVTAFNGGTSGANLLTNIISTTTSYPFPGAAAKATARTDCAGSTCTFAEEMTNYANWWAYYHTRMQMMKTSASLAFQTVGSTYRVGYATINNNQGSAFVNLGTFDITQKRAWYSKLFAAKPSNSTPLRQTLSEIGRIYAGQFNGKSYNGVTVTDPMQYACQQNFTILSTDGYWNEADNLVIDLNGSSIGNQDSGEGRPMNDGGGVTVTATTPSVSTSVDTTPRIVVDRSTRTDSTVTTATMHRTDSYTRTQIFNNASCPGGKRQKTYTGTSTETQTTTTTSSQPMEMLTTTLFSDAATTTTTATRSVVTLNGVVTSDTTLTTSTGPTTVSSVTSGPTAVTGAFGAATISPVFNSTFSPAATVAAISWSGVLTDTCIANTSASDTLVVATAGPWSVATTTAGPTTTAGGLTHTAGYPQTSFGTTTNATTGPTVGGTTTTSVTTGGTSNTLSDVAEYYYINDLRTPALGNCTGAPVSGVGLDVCENIVPSSGLDAASHQHMTTFTLGLGASGFMQFAPNYVNASSGDFSDIKKPNSANAAGGICAWQSDGTACNWPAPVSNQQTTIDDLWHAAVNGRGSYFSATNPASLDAGLSSALAGVTTRTGSSAAATTSNPNVTSGDNFVFSSTFTTQQWDGELVRQQLDLVTGAVSSALSTPTCAGDWCAQVLLDSNITRKLYMFDPLNAAGNKLKAFDWAHLTTTERANFNTPNISGLSQFCVAGTCLNAAQQTAAAGANLVSYLGGDHTNEGFPADVTKYYRQRAHLLGDIVNAEAAYVRLPLFAYADAGYSDFITAQGSRQGMVYVAANDGMLHAFNATNGVELFTYVPSMVLPNLYKLADQNYASLHQYSVDGTPVAGDICPTAPTTPCTGSTWKTIMVGGLNSGGRGYYALDVTDPSVPPAALWEFTDTNMGSTFGDPTITKLQDGTWVVLVASGYNNVAPGDGVGRLYVLNAATGALIRTISTGAGNVTTPSGLARVSAWVDNTTVDNTAKRAYGGDMLGNLWRFDIDGNVGAAGFDAQKLVTLFADTTGTVTQPITTRPELGDVSGVAVVFVGTGRFLGVSDLSDTTQQTFYAVKDTLGTTTFTNPKATGSTFVQQTLTTSACPAGSPATICSTGQTVRTSTSNTVNFATNNGWYVNLPDSGERSNTDPTLAGGTLGFTTNVPSTSACTAGGFSFRYLLDFRTGAPVSTSTTGVSVIKLGNALATRAVFVRLPNNTVVQLTRLSDGTTMTTNVPITNTNPSARRVSWRELIQDQ